MINENYHKAIYVAKNNFKIYTVMSFSGMGSCRFSENSRSVLKNNAGLHISEGM